MPYPLLKSENYANLSGIDIKASQYLTDQTEFLNLQNVDFRSLGALSSFAGSTNFSTTNATGPIFGVAGYYKESYSSVPNATASYSIIVTDSNWVYSVTGTTFSPLMGKISVGFSLGISPTQFLLAGQTFAGALFGCDGVNFWTFQGSTLALQFSLGKPMWGVAQNSGVTLVTRAGVNAGLSGFLINYYALVREDGLYGPTRAVTFTCVGETNLVFRLPRRPNLATGCSLGSFGLSGIQVWTQLNNGPIYSNVALFGVTTGGTPTFAVGYNYTAVGWSQNINIPAPYDYQGSFMYGLGSTQGGFEDIALVTNRKNPNVMAYYANQLFTTGFGGFPCRVVFSNPGTPEIADYANFFDVAPTDSASITAMECYFTSLIIFKRRGTWQLTGTGPDSFQLTQVSTIFGCVSANANCVWDQNFWFLDEKGICEYNGANTKIVSAKIQPIFDRMNLDAVAQQAIMIHVKELSQIWCAIPIDGSQYNNLIVVYDYLANGWTTRTCPPGDLTALNVVSLGNSKQTTYYGTYSGMLGTFGASMIGDNGVAFTSVIKSRFLSDLGNSVTKVFRRLYLDAAVPTGQTQSIQVNLYADKNTTAYYSTTMVISSAPVQQRIDFGVPAKSMAVEFVYNGNGGALALNGFTIEFRYQRST